MHSTRIKIFVYINFKILVLQSQGPLPSARLCNGAAEGGAQRRVLGEDVPVLLQAEEVTDCHELAIRPHNVLTTLPLKSAKKWCEF